MNPTVASSAAIPMLTVATNTSARNPVMSVVMSVRDVGISTEMAFGEEEEPLGLLDNDEHYPPEYEGASE